jgi:ADP-ribose pyrophosphatase
MRPTVQVKTTHAGRLLRVEVLSWTDKRGCAVVREVVRHPGAVLILPVRNDGRLVLIRNERIAAQERLWEFPAGTLKPDEEPAAAAARELEEETGYSASSWRRIGEFFTSPGFADELIHVFLASQLTPGRMRLDPGESIEVVSLTTDEVDRMVRSGEVRDGKTLAALELWRAQESELNE